MGQSPAFLSAREIQAGIRSGDFTAHAVTQEFLDRIASIDSQIHAWLDIWPDRALERAAEIDTALGQGQDPGPLAGVPIAIKDNICTLDGRTTCASRMLSEFTSPYDATAVTKLRESGAVILGKTNLDEFAMGSSCENSGVRSTMNPWDTTRVPGGSSGGSAAAVAARLAACALGSDTGGSIRQPAAFCGCVGLKPTYGRVSRHGLVAFASSLDQIGPITQNVEDAALVLNAICGIDPFDATSADVPVPDFLTALNHDLNGLNVGIPTEYFGDGLDGEVQSHVESAVKALTDAGATAREVSLPYTRYGVPAYYIIANAEASANLARYDGVRYGFRAETVADGLDEMYTQTRTEGFGSEVKRRILLGTYVLSSGYYDAYYLKAQKVRALIKRDFDAVFEDVDVLVTPTAPTPAFRIGEKSDTPLEMYLSDIYTTTANLAGVPAVSIPCGVTRGGLPVGLQLMGRPFEEDRLIRVAYAYEQRANLDIGRPALAHAV